jgi:hypothetical protein
MKTKTYEAEPLPISFTWSIRRRQIRLCSAYPKQKADGDKRFHGFY